MYRPESSLMLAEVLLSTQIKLAFRVKHLAILSFRTSAIYFMVEKKIFCAAHKTSYTTFMENR